MVSAKSRAVLFIEPIIRGSRSPMVSTVLYCSLTLRMLRYRTLIFLYVIKTLYAVYLSLREVVEGEKKKKKQYWEENTVQARIFS